MENEVGALRLATRHFMEASHQIAEFLISLSQCRDKLWEDSTFSEAVWQFIEDLLACRFLACKRKQRPHPSPDNVADEFQGMLKQNAHNAVPWVLSESTRDWGFTQRDIILQCAARLEKIPCDRRQIWLFGSLHEYRTGLLFQTTGRGSNAKIKMVKNSHKKKQAIYYTPRDVVEFILQYTLRPFLEKIELKLKRGLQKEAISDFYRLSLLDPSCGGGAFLLPAWQQFLRFFEEHFQNGPINPPEHPILLGIDIDLPAVRVAHFSLWLTTPQNHPLANAYAIMEGNALWPGNSEVIPRFSFAEQFPHLFSKAGNKGFMCVIGNPPYAGIPQTWPVEELTRYFQSTSSKDLYTLFLEQIIHLSNPEIGRGGMIVPLSLTFSKDMNAIRNFILTSGCKWKISSYHIRPSGIFPGVSQRTSIALVEPSLDNKTHIETTCVQRWPAEKRADLFNNLRYADVTDCIETIANQGRPLGFPNIGNPHLSSLLLKLLQRGEKLGDALNPSPHSSGDSTTLYYFTMAYHWLTLSARLPDLNGANKSVALTSLIPLYFTNEANRWVGLALLASSLGFWWWQIFGDLFHVTRSVLSQFPVNPATVDPKIKDLLVDRAKELQGEINENVTFFTKKGVTNANFDLTRCFGKIRPIDQLLKKYLDISTEEWNALDANYTETTGKNIK